MTNRSRLRPTATAVGVLPNPPPGTILADIREYFEGIGMPSYRFRQLFVSLQQGTINFGELRELPKTAREQLIARFGQSPIPLHPVVVQSAEQVAKVLFETRSGARIETVLSRYRAGWTSMCISSQAGCGLGCTFCATGAMGLSRNLTADEICAQIFHPHWQQSNVAIPDSIAFMGMGEALANPHVFTAIHVLTAAGLGGISPRRITVSTVGHAPNLERLTREHPQVAVTLSVHSPFPQQRAALIPLENRFSLVENLSILDKHVVAARRKVYLAYLLIAGINDSTEHLKALIELIKSRSRPELFHVSVIRYNDAFGADPSFRAPTSEQVSSFVAQLHKQGIHATRRQQFGSDIDAACGQLHVNNLRDGRRS